MDSDGGGRENKRNVASCMIVGETRQVGEDDEVSVVSDDGDDDETT